MIHRHREVATIRTIGHPQYPHALWALGDIIWVHCERFNDPQDLNESIRLLREAVSLFSSSSGIDRFRALTSLTCALMLRFRYHGVVDDVDESVVLSQQALVLLPERHIYRPSALNRHAEALIARFRVASHPKDLSEAIELHRAALDQLPVGHTSRDLHLNNLAIALRLQYERIGPGDRQLYLQEAIELQREALRLRPPGHPDRESSVSNLAALVSLSFKASGNYTLLEECLLLDQEALSSSSDIHHPDRPQILCQHSQHLHARFLQHGQENDLRVAIDMCREAVELFPKDHSGRPISQYNLSVLLTGQFRLFQKQADLDEVVELRREVLHVLPVLHVEYPTYLRGLADSLHVRYTHAGDHQDLHVSLDLYQQVLDRLTPEHSSRAHSLTNFAIAKCSLFQVSKRGEDLAEAIDILREACDLFGGHVFHPTSVMNLASALYTEYMRKGRKAAVDLYEPISLSDELVRGLPHDHSLMNTLRNFLSILLIARFAITRNHRDYLRARELQKALVAEVPIGSAMRAKVMDTMARLYLTRESDEADFTSGLHLITEYLQDSVTTPRLRVEMAIRRLADAESWISPQFVLSADQREQLVTAYKHAIVLLPQIAAFDLGTSAQLLALRETLQADDIVAHCANHLLALGRSEEAIEILEAGRAVIWSQALRLRTSVDNLKVVNAGLADKLRSISQQLKTSFGGSQTLITDDASSILSAMDQEYYRTQDEALRSDREAARRRDLSASFSATLSEARSIPGFERLMLNETYSSLSQAASCGPVVMLVHQYAIVVASPDQSPIHVRISVPKVDLQKLQDVLNPRNTLQNRSAIMTRELEGIEHAQ